MSEEKICFVICPIGDENTPIRKRSDQIFKHIIEPIVKKNGYRCLRADHIQSPGLITSQVIEYLINSDLVIADLSGHNPNVFYELAIRHAIQKPVIQLIEKNENIPFDISGLRTIYVITEFFDLDNIESVKKDIVAQIESLKGGDQVINPIFDALRIKLSKDSEDLAKITLGDIYEEMQNIKIELANMKRLNKSEYALGRTVSEMPPREQMVFYKGEFVSIDTFEKELANDIIKLIAKENGVITYQKLLSEMKIQGIPEDEVNNCLELFNIADIITWDGSKLTMQSEIILRRK